MSWILGDKFCVGRRLGSGSFGDVYSARDVHTGKEVAIKLESIKSRHPNLLYEFNVCKALSAGIGTTNVHWYGTEGGYNFMVMDVLGPSLEDLFTFSNQRFSLKTLLMLTDQMISRVEFVHANNFVHRDIKPGNFLVGLGKTANLVHLIDFGLANQYKDPNTKKHIKYREHQGLTGTALYASINTHRGCAQSRRDDLEAVGYVLMYFSRGSLPWQRLKGSCNKELYDKIMEKKISTPIEMLSKHLPDEFVTYLSYCQSLQFKDRPDYSFLRGLMKYCFFRNGFQYHPVFDWTCFHDPSDGENEPESGQQYVTEGHLQDHHERFALSHTF